MGLSLMNFIDFFFSFIHSPSFYLCGRILSFRWTKKEKIVSIKVISIFFGTWRNHRVNFLILGLVLLLLLLLKIKLRTKQRRKTWSMILQAKKFYMCKTNVFVHIVIKIDFSFCFAAFDAASLLSVMNDWQQDSSFTTHFFRLLLIYYVWNLLIDWLIFFCFTRINKWSELIWLIDLLKNNRRKKNYPESESRLLHPPSPSIFSHFAFPVFQNDEKKHP